MSPERRHAEEEFPSVPLLYPGMLRWRAHFSSRAQERIMNIAIAADARVSALESLFVKLVLVECQGGDRDPKHVVPRASDRNDGVSVSFPDSCWEVLDTVDLQEVFQCRFSVLQNCPHHVRGRFRMAARVALKTRSHAVRTQDHQGEVRGWKLFCLLPMLFLRRGSGRRVTKEESRHRFDLFTSGEWASLFQEANIATRTQQGPVHRKDSSDRRAAAACLKVQQGEVTRARQCLTGAPLASGNEDTLREMQSRRPQQVQRPIPRQVLEFQPDS